MHRIAAIPGGWTPDREGVVFVEQTPAPIVILTAADTDTQTLAIATQTLPSDFPQVRVANLLNLQQELTIDTYAETVLAQAQVIVLRLLGGRSYWSYGLEVCKSLTSDRNEIKLIVLPGDDGFDPDLVSHSNVPLGIVDRVWRYFLNGGVENAIAALQFLSDAYLYTAYQPHEPKVIPKIGLYRCQRAAICAAIENQQQTKGVVGILFYRAHYLSGNLKPICALFKALSDRGLKPIPVFVYSMQDPDLDRQLQEYFLDAEGNNVIDVLLNTTSFSLSKPNAEDKGNIWRSLNVPILQVILSSSTVEQWQENSLGLSPRDVAMNVALPEVDGRIITRAVSFKSVSTRDSKLETDIIVYEPIQDRIDFVADLAANWAKLRRKPVSDRKVALILANYPTRNGRLANGVGLDTPASCIHILKAMAKEGYQVSSLPQDGDALIRQLTQGITNDLESQSSVNGSQLSVVSSLSLAEYIAFFDGLPIEVRERVVRRWGEPSTINSHAIEENRHQGNDAFAIAGIQFGNVFVGIQPARGYDLDPSLNYHAPDLEPPHAYFAFYAWLRKVFEVDVIAHIGKHGNLEWLPGKSLALSEDCFPEAVFGALPHLYPFIVNDPGEGTQAKRRSQAVIIDHLTPPMTRADTYGGLQKLEHLIDEYHESQSLDPSRSKLIQQKILELVEQENLQHDLKSVIGELLTGESPTNRMLEAQYFSEFVAQTDGYLCELKEAQIRDGLHIFGQCPEGRQLRDLIVAIARNPAGNTVSQGLVQRLGVTQAIAQKFHLDFDPLAAEPSQPFIELPEALVKYLDRQDSEFPNTQAKCHIVGDAIAALENYATEWVDRYLNPSQNHADSLADELDTDSEALIASIHQALLQTDREVINFLKGLQGEYVPSGASGAPTRGRLDVLPTGKNFYSVDIRAIPTETAWDVGRRSAELVVEAYTQEHGDYPRSLGLSVWGTSTMRTGGDDIAEALALIGAQPVWDGASRRVVDFCIIPLSVLGRPRVDVTLRISGFFRDGFANLISLFDLAVQMVAALDEPDEMNPLKAQVARDTEILIEQGVDIEQAKAKAGYRVFGSKPGAYGAGLQGLIEGQNWESERDLAQAYMNWSGYAYTGFGNAHAAPEVLEERLKQLQIVLQNQDNREHDLLDSDDYYQFQGGMTASVRSLTGQNPKIYFGDHSRPQNPKVRSLASEIARVYRSRVVNPKWIEGMMRHGYKGAFEMAATIDYLFAYDATTQVVPDFMYEGVANAYLLDAKVQEFIKSKNPWALRDMAERLLEANQRGLWQDISADMKHQLRSLVLEAEATIESM
ncbi:cobaltochelatase subunit CobN [Tumidithrix helvetica PCC 7403]|uniref:cobaltochelatase subunit CobN n=1 Tax=Tumidithrix helvetica TaxID=3457545 RepID=UPI003CAED5CF